MTTRKDAVTFTLPSGTKVTAPLHVAKRMGYKPPTPRRKKTEQ